MGLSGVQAYLTQTDIIAEDCRYCSDAHVGHHMFIMPHIEQR